MEALNGDVTNFKERHEEAVAKRLLDKLQIKTGSLRLGTPPEPDVLLGLGGQNIGVEVATAYYSQDEARLEWQHARGKKECASSSIWEPDRKICESIQREINDKCKKQYQGGDEVWLCIDADAPLGDQQSMDACIDHLCTPKGHNFNRIYLLHHAPWVARGGKTEQGGDKAVELYPTKGRWSASPGLTLGFL